MDEFFGGFMDVWTDSLNARLDMYKWVDGMIDGWVDKCINKFGVGR